MIQRARARFDAVVTVAFLMTALHCQEATRDERQAATAPSSKPRDRIESAHREPPAPSASAAALVTLPDSSQRSRPEAAPLDPIGVTLDAPEDKQEEARRLVAQLKPSLTRCRQLAQQAAGAARLEGRLRIRARVARSGKVVATDLPVGNRTNPVYDPETNGAPIPNPSRASLSTRFVPCLVARVLGSRLGASDSDWTFTFDVRLR